MHCLWTHPPAYLGCFRVFDQLSPFLQSGDLGHKILIHLWNAGEAHTYVVLFMAWLSRTADLLFLLLLLRTQRPC